VLGREFFHENETIYSFADGHVAALVNGERGYFCCTDF
jgi:prepilin-type processing-associated H-X9-DG protein